MLFFNLSTYGDGNMSDVGHVDGVDDDTVVFMVSSCVGAHVHMGGCACMHTHMHTHTHNGAYSCTEPPN